MIYTIFSTRFLVGIGALAALVETVPVHGSQPAAENREVVVQLNDLLSHPASNEKNALKVQLAVAYYKDQEWDKAFRVFLDVLGEVPLKHKPVLMTEEENTIYEMALKVYLDGSNSPQENARRIIQQFSPVLSSHPEFYQLGFIVAAAYGNLDQYDQFFQTFYPSYLSFPHHFLAFKTKANLLIKLYEREPAGPEKEKEKEWIFANLSDAIRAYPMDISLYKMVVVFAPEKEKTTVLADNLNKILRSNMIIPRGEVIYFIQQATERQQYSIAQKLIDRAKEWYPRSRSIEAAEQNLILHKTK